MAPITNTVTVLSDPVIKKPEEEDNLQIRWSDSSNSDGDDGEVADCDDRSVAEVQDEEMSSRSSTGLAKASNGDFKFSFAANVNSGAQGARLRQSMEAAMP